MCNIHFYFTHWICRINHFKGIPSRDLQDISAHNNNFPLSNKETRALSTYLCQGPTLLILLISAMTNPGKIPGYSDPDLHQNGTSCLLYHCQYFRKVSLKPIHKLFKKNRQTHTTKNTRPLPWYYLPPSITGEKYLFRDIHNFSFSAKIQHGCQKW